MNIEPGFKQTPKSNMNINSGFKQTLKYNMNINSGFKQTPKYNMCITPCNKISHFGYLFKNKSIFAYNFRNM